MNAPRRFHNPLEQRVAELEIYKKRFDWLRIGMKTFDFSVGRDTVGVRRWRPEPGTSKWSWTAFSRFNSMEEAIDFAISISEENTKRRSVLIPGSVWHYDRCMECGNSCTGHPLTCGNCGGLMLLAGLPAPDTSIEDWQMILEGA